MSAIDTFRRAMRRHEKRARSMRMPTTASALTYDHAAIGWTLEESERWYRESALMLRPRPTDRRSKDHDYGRRAAWLYDRAADAVARLRDGLRREREQAEREEAERPYVCPECYCVGPEPHAPGCWEEERERRADFGPEDDDGEDDEYDGMTYYDAWYLP